MYLQPFFLLFFKLKMGCWCNYKLIYNYLCDTLNTKYKIKLISFKRVWLLLFTQHVLLIPN